MLDHTLEQGNPADASSSLLPSNESSPAPGAVPEPVTADRGYGEKGIDEALHQMGVRTRRDPPQGQA